MIVDPDFPDHWKTQLLVQLLGEAAPLGMIRLWGHCQARREDRFELTPTQLAAITRLGAASPAKVERALCEARFIEREGKVIYVRGWRERNAKLFTNAANGAKGGRPRKNLPETHGEPTDNPSVTNGKPTGNPTVTQAEPKGNPTETDKRRVEESRREPTPRASAPVRACESDVLSETWSFILQLLGAKKRRAGHEAEHALARQSESLPLADEQRALLAWFYQIPPDEKDIDLRGRYRDADKLATHLFVALERAERYAELHGGPRPKKESAPWPEGAREWLEQRYPGSEIPDRFNELPRDVREIWQQQAGAAA